MAAPAWSRKEVTRGEEKRRCAPICKRRCEAGYAVLKNGGSSLDAVSTGDRADGRFAAVQRRQGRGVQSRRQRTNSMPSIMDGATLRAGSVANVHRVKNPDPAGARGDGKIAARDAGRRRRRGVRAVDRHDAGRSEIFLHRRALAAIAGGVEGRSSKRRNPAAPHHGTVGAVALDRPDISPPAPRPAA